MLFLGIEKRNICIWDNKQILFTYKYELKLRRNLYHNITEGLILKLGLEVIDAGILAVVNIFLIVDLENYF